MQVLTKYQSSFILCVISGGVGYRIKSVSTFAFINSYFCRPINPKNALEPKSWQAYGRKKLDSSTFVGGKISAWD